MELDEHVRTNNNIETTKDSYGVCISMTTQWILASMRYNGVTRSWQVGSSGSFLVRQAAGMIGQQTGDENIIQNAGLSILGECNDPSLTDIATPGYHILSIWNAGGTEGHSMGTRVTANAFEFFDPNFGLYHANSAIGLAGDAYAHCLRWYPGLQAEHISRQVA